MACGRYNELVANPKLDMRPMAFCQTLPVAQRLRPVSCTYITSHNWNNQRFQTIPHKLIQHNSTNFPNKSHQKWLKHGAPICVQRQVSCQIRCLQETMRTQNIVNHFRRSWAHSGACQVSGYAYWIWDDLSRVTGLKESEQAENAATHCHTQGQQTSHLATFEAEVANVCPMCVMASKESSMSSEWMAWMEWIAYQHDGLQRISGQSHCRKNWICVQWLSVKRCQLREGSGQFLAHI